ncbi:MAG: hypothetical protein ACXVIJ_06685 [Thermoanaerobaculia bacterium]
MDTKQIEFDAVTAMHMPLNERVLDRLADILLASDDILDMLATDRHMPDDNSVDLERSVRSVFDQVNDLMKKIAD